MAWTDGVDYSTGQLISATIWNNYLGAAGDIDLTAPGVVTTAGDTVYATGDNTLARLAIGNAGTVMSSTGSAVQWGLTLTNSITAGSTQTQAGATALTTMVNRVTVSGTNGDGVKLPTAIAGLEILIINDDSAQTIQIWPNTSDAIDGGSANAVDANALDAGSSRRYIAVDATNWYTASPAGGAGVTGPGSSTDNAITTWSGTDGDTLQQQAEWIIADDGTAIITPTATATTGIDVIGTALTAKTFRVYSNQNADTANFLVDFHCANTAYDKGGFIVNYEGSDNVAKFVNGSSNDGTMVFMQNFNTSADGTMCRIEQGRSANTTSSFIVCRSAYPSSTDTEFKLRGDGEAYADGSWNNSGADFAEYFESATGNPITVGMTVVLEGNKVRKALASEQPFGVVRPKAMNSASMVIGNTAWNMWHSKYLQDEYGAYVMEDAPVIRWVEQMDFDGQPGEKAHAYETDRVPSDIEVPDDAEIETHSESGQLLERRKLNPDFDPNEEYVAREDRDEWVIIGILGQIPIAKSASKNDNWVKMRDLSDTVEEWLVK